MSLNANRILGIQMIDAMTAFKQTKMGFLFGVSKVDLQTA
jgi:hypothetical protein